jgi:nucleoside-diphosphate-sugar epimerase
VAGRVYNIAGGCQATVLDVVSMLEQILGRPSNARTSNRSPATAEDRSDTTAAHEDLGYRPSTGLEDGLRRQVAAMRANAVEEA